MATKTKSRSKKPVAKKRAPTKVKVKTVLQRVVLPASDVPAIGQPWPGSKDLRIAEIAGRDGQPNYHLLLVCDDAGKPVVLENEQWGVYGKTISGANSFSDGLANTEAMLKADNALAKKVRGFGLDCYLPALFELQAICANNTKLLPLSYLWSSTQYGDYNARCQNFEDGHSTWGLKNSRFHACVVRRVPIQAQ